jgi:hypothetical protein
MSSLLDCGVIILAVTPLLKEFFYEEGVDIPEVR